MSRRALHLAKDRHERWTSLCKEARKANFNCEDYSKLITALSLSSSPYGLVTKPLHPAYALRCSSSSSLAVPCPQHCINIYITRFCIQRCASLFKRCGLKCALTAAFSRNNATCAVVVLSVRPSNMLYEPHRYIYLLKIINAALAGAGSGRQCSSNSSRMLFNETDYERAA